MEDGAARSRQAVFTILYPPSSILHPLSSFSPPPRSLRLGGEPLHIAPNGPPVIATARIGDASMPLIGIGRPTKKKRLDGIAPRFRRHSITGTSTPALK